MLTVASIMVYPNVDGLCDLNKGVFPASVHSIALFLTCIIADSPEARRFDPLSLGDF